MIKIAVLCLELKYFILLSLLIFMVCEWHPSGCDRILLDTEATYSYLSLIMQSVLVDLVAVVSWTQVFCYVKSFNFYDLWMTS